MKRINRNNFDTKKVMDMIGRDAIDSSESIRLLEEACHVISNERHRNNHTKIILKALLNSMELA